MICFRYKVSIVTCFIICSLIISFSGGNELLAVQFNSPEGAEFIPQWQVGDRWVVKTESITQTANGVTNSHSRKSSVQNLWMYKVISIRDEVINGEDIRFFHLMASNWRSKRKELGGFLFAGKLNAGRTRVVSLALIQSGWQNGQAAISITRNYSKMAKNPFPIINDYSPVPISFPVFLGNRILGGTMGFTFEITEKIGVLPFAKDVEQSVFAVGNIENLKLKISLSETAKKSICEVIIKRFDDNYRVRQLWQKDYPWFLYSDNGDFKAWLVKYKRKS